MYLFIHTPTPQNTYLLLSKKGKLFVTKKIPYTKGKRRNLIADIDSLFKTYTCAPKKIRGVVVLSGPGQFSYLRTGIAVANAFGYALGIPISGISAMHSATPEDFFFNGLKKILKAKKGNYSTPEYGSEPNITKGKPLL